MKIYALPFLIKFVLFQSVRADVAGDITWIEDGYNFIAKIPCEGCPFLHQDTSQGEDAAWTTRADENSLLLNFSMPFKQPHIILNNAILFPNPSKPPIIFANQVLADLSIADLQSRIEAHQLEASHESNQAGGYFGLSYRQSLRPIKDSAAVVFHFDITDLYSELPEKPLQFKLDGAKQTMIEMVLLQRPMLSALETPGFEIVQAALVPRTQNPISPKSASEQVMTFQDWDSFGRKGTTRHLFNSWGDSLLNYLDSGIWPLFVFIFAVIGLFVVVCMLCIFGCEMWTSDEYEKAQHGKQRRKGSGRKKDMETGRRPFKSPEELGLMGRGKVIGVGKSD